MRRNQSCLTPLFKKPCVLILNLLVSQAFQKQHLRAMILTSAVLFILIAGGLAYPGGAPSCTARPGHGNKRGNVNAQVENIGGNNWKVLLLFNSILLLKVNIHCPSPTQSVGGTRLFV